MSSIVLKKATAGAMLLFMACVCFASNNPPRTLKEPVLGLRYNVSTTRFEPLPAIETAKCETNDNATSVWFIYAKHKTNSGRVYYISGGYTVWRNPEPGQPKYEADEYGGVFYIEGEKCAYIDEVRQTFIDRVFNDEMDLQTLHGLASDYAIRLQKAFGGTERLRLELRNQKVDPDDLPAEIHEVLKPYFSPASTSSTFR